MAVTHCPVLTRLLNSGVSSRFWDMGTLTSSTGMTFVLSILPALP